MSGLVISFFANLFKEIASCFGRDQKVTSAWVMSGSMVGMVSLRSILGLSTYVLK